MNTEPAYDTDQLGYSFYPPEEPHDLGHARLKVVIRPEPTGKHYDPESLTCSIAGRSGPEPLHVRHPWTLEPTYRVCAGHVTLDDRKGKQVVAFTFGGELRIDANPQRTICRLTSPVPILHHSPGESPLERRLSEEVEILLAERRAAYVDEDRFERRLAAADPVQLYWACLAALCEKFDCAPDWHEAVVDQLRHILHTALATRLSKLALKIPPLAEVV
jgi:hypothetical protein